MYHPPQIIHQEKSGGDEFGYEQSYQSGEEINTDSLRPAFHLQQRTGQKNDNRRQGKRPINAINQPFPFAGKLLGYQFERLENIPGRVSTKNSMKIQEPKSLLI